MIVIVNTGTIYFIQATAEEFRKIFSAMSVAPQRKKPKRRTPNELACKPMIFSLASTSFRCEIERRILRRPSIMKKAAALMRISWTKKRTKYAPYYKLLPWYRSSASPFV